MITKIRVAFQKLKIFTSVWYTSVWDTSVWYTPVWYTSVWDTLTTDTVATTSLVYITTKSSWAAALAQATGKCC